MQSKFLIAAVTVLIVAGAAPAAAQQQSKSSRSAQVVLVARMPETLTFAVNSGAPPDPFTETTHQTQAQIASSITTSWVLAQGRSRVVTWAQAKLPPSPVLIALAAPVGLPGYGESREDSGSAFHLPQQSLDKAKDKISRLDSLTITDGNRAATNTICLSDSIGPEEVHHLADNDYVGIVKIKIQAVP